MAIAKKIGYQFPATPEGKLMRGVFLRAVDDLFLHTQRRSAVLHLQGRIHEAEWCGIDSDWIRLQFKRAGLTIEEIDP